MSREQYCAMLVVLGLAGHAFAASPQEGVRIAPTLRELTVDMESRVARTESEVGPNLSFPFPVRMPTLEEGKADLNTAETAADNSPGALTDEEHRAARLERGEGFLNEDHASRGRSPSSLRPRRRDGHFRMAEFDRRLRRLDRHRDRFELHLLPFAGERQDLRATTGDHRLLFTPRQMNRLIERRLPSGSRPANAFLDLATSESTELMIDVPATAQANADTP